MGCWNETDMVSNLPIIEDEDVMVIILAENKIGSGGCHPTDYWMPVISFHGKYAGYERVESYDSRIDHIIWEGLKESGLENWKDEEGNPLYTEDSQDVFSAKNFVEKIGYDAKHCNLLYGHLRLAVVFIKDQLLTRLKQDVDLIQLQRRQSELAQNICPSSVTGLSFLCDSAFGPFRIVSHKLVSAMLDADNDFTANMFKEMIFVNNALAILRKSWHIPSGRGSQDWVVSTMETLHQYIGEEIQYLENYDFREDEYHEADFV